MDRAKSYSLRRRLLVRIWGPLILVLMLSAVATFTLARYIGTVVYDRWLYDSAMTLAQQIRIKDGKAVLDVSGAAIEMFEWDSVDHIFEEVRSHKDGLIFGNAVFPRVSDDLAVDKPRFYDARINGKSVRVAAVRLTSAENQDAFVVQVAETKKKRHSLIADILLFVVPLQTLILVLASTLVWFVVTSSLKFLDTIAERLVKYEPESLVPVSDIELVPNEVKPLLDSINRLITKLADARDTQRRFIANAAHQLRTPLAALQVQTERALREPDLERHNEALSHVLTAITRSRRLVRQLLTLARSEKSNEQTLEMVDVDLAELAREELEQWADAAIARDIDLGYEGPERGVLLSAEPHLLREMIGNLVDNAIRYGRAGGVVTLQLTAPPVVLSVEDDGPGIPAGERELVIERFYRPTGATGDGCGLGLAIAREIAMRHNACLNISDNPRGNGTRVEVVFPA